MLITAGLIFAWAGDIFLLFDTKNPGFFIAGLASFLVTHVLYILYFLSFLLKGSAGKNTPVWIDAFIGIYGFTLLYMLWPGLAGMKFPVIVYAICICTMAILSMRCKKVMPTDTWKWFSTGAMLFVISDSILAVNKFLNPSDIAPPLVMLTYGLAQMFIVVGAAKLSAIKQYADPKPGV